MGDENKILSQIHSLTKDLIQVGLCDDQNYAHIVSLKGDVKKVTIGRLETTIFLKNVSYRDIYYEMLEKRAFNMKMIDGALILMEYSFGKEGILHHRLSFFPSPDLLEYQSNEELYLEDEIYLDILEKQVVTVPLRFDYDEEEASPIEHPISHLTVGQYTNCRIPVTSAVPPGQFVEFVVRNFYHTAYHKYCDRIGKYPNEFPRTLLKEEEALIYMNIPL